MVASWNAIVFYSNSFRQTPRVALDSKFHNFAGLAGRNKEDNQVSRQTIERRTGAKTGRAPAIRKLFEKRVRQHGVRQRDWLDEQHWSLYQKRYSHQLYTLHNLRGKFKKKQQKYKVKLAIGRTTFLRTSIDESTSGLQPTWPTPTSSSSWSSTNRTNHNRKFKFKRLLTKPKKRQCTYISLMAAQRLTQHLLTIFN